VDAEKLAVRDRKRNCGGGYTCLGAEAEGRRGV